MIVNRTSIEIACNGRTFRLDCPAESTWNEVVQVLSQMYSFAQERVQATAKTDEVSSEDASSEEIV